MKKLREQFQEQTGKTIDLYTTLSNFYYPNPEYVIWLERKVMTKKCNDCCEDWQEN